MSTLTQHTLTARTAVQQACGAVYRQRHTPREMAEALHHLADTASALGMVVHHLRRHLSDTDNTTFRL